MLYYLQTQFKEPFLQSAAIQITLNHVPITIASVYCPLRHNISTIMFDDYFSTLGHNFIVGGDLNAKNIDWGCHSNNPKGISQKQISLI
jgi:hypothetical protein